MAISPFRKQQTGRAPLPVRCKFNATGNLMPLEIRWVDGSVYEIDRVTHSRQAAAMKAGGQGDRYTIKICGKQSYTWIIHKHDLKGRDTKKSQGFMRLQAFT